MRVHLIAASVLMTVALAGCGADDDGGANDARPAPSVTTSPSARTPPSGTERCGGDRLASAKPVQVPSARGALYGLEAGTGSKALLLIHGSGSGGVCVWQRELPAFAAAGYRVLAIDHGCIGSSACPAGPADLVADIRAATEHLRATNASSVVVIGASAGTAQVIAAAATSTVPLTAAVALSPAFLDQPVSTAGDGPKTARQAPASVRVPILYVVAADDRLASVTDTKALHDATPAAHRNLLSVPAGGHAQQLLYATRDSDAAFGGAIYDGVIAFVRKHST